MMSRVLPDHMSPYVFYIVFNDTSFIPINRNETSHVNTMQLSLSLSLSPRCRFLADRTACYWRDTVDCLSVCLWRCALWLNDTTSYSKVSEQVNRKCPVGGWFYYVQTVPTPALCPKMSHTKMSNCLWRTFGGIHASQQQLRGIKADLCTSVCLNCEPISSCSYTSTSYIQGVPKKRHPCFIFAITSVNGHRF